MVSSFRHTLVMATRSMPHQMDVNESEWTETCAADRVMDWV